MPKVRAPKARAAADLQRPSRLPLGTQLSKSPPPHSPHLPPSRSISKTLLGMAPEIKRIEQAEAALAAPKLTAKARAKAWKPFDFGGGEATPSGPSPVVETRVNVFRPASSASLSRPISRISHATGDSDGRESSQLESDDFQLFTGRKTRRQAAEERPEPPQITVEATFSKREICDVFGNELPGTSFLEWNPGTVHGQLQFIQHPNGDVYAHQWQASQYEWNNIGSFSNIRKKVEGGLARERLVGETALQSLHQNTLIYFRTIARQREALQIGLPFGQKEIVAALPDIRPPSAAPPVPKMQCRTVEMPTPPAARKQDAIDDSIGQITEGTDDPNARPVATRLVSGAGSTVTGQPPPHTSQRTPSYPSYNAPTYTPYTNDPYYQASYAQPYSVNPSYLQTMQHPSYYPQYSQQWGTSPTYYQQPMQTPSYMTPAAYPPHPSYGQTGLDAEIQRMRAHASSQQSSPATASQGSAQQSSFHMTAAGHTPRRSDHHHASSSSQPPSTPYVQRTAMRESILRMSETRGERTKNLANSRTVLHDPFLAQPKSVESTPAAVPVPELPVTPVKEPVNRQRSPSVVTTGGVTMPARPARPLARSVAVPSISLAPRLPDTASIPSENDLRNSSPDREWQRKPAETYHVDVAPLLDLEGSKKWDATNFKEWYWDYTKFARHEEFFDRLKASSGSPSTTTAPQLAPIGPPRKDSKASGSGDGYNEKMTRLWIPVLETLASYTTGPEEKRRDYFSRWAKAPEHAIDRSARGHESFWDSPADDASADTGATLGSSMRFGSVECVIGGGVLDRRFAPVRYGTE
ncbi:hypothetical protein B0A48_13225 [Cryoendolithus antarcticus]|uniref:Uncharacterized protein n=1 Tax=Cryoendolithus antarcticus TaxID=1507870 RepID=A0A1V8SNU9_9PEZI|nr:hypothetical protein B0A48_13225 [Cryoendolithus antarcticus]